MATKLHNLVTRSTPGSPFRSEMFALLGITRCKNKPSSLPTKASAHSKFPNPDANPRRLPNGKRRLACSMFKRTSSMYLGFWNRGWKFETGLLRPLAIPLIWLGYRHKDTGDRNVVRLTFSVCLAANLYFPIPVFWPNLSLNETLEPLLAVRKYSLAKSAPRLVLQKRPLRVSPALQ